MEQQGCRGKVGQWPQVRKHGANGSQWQCGSCRPFPRLMDLPQGVAPTVSVKQTARALSEMPSQWNPRSPSGPAGPGPAPSSWDTLAMHGVHHANMADHGLLADYSLQGMTAHGTRAIPFVREALSPYYLAPSAGQKAKGSEHGKARRVQQTNQGVAHFSVALAAFALLRRL